MAPGFRTLEHPADVGMEARGGSLKEAFEQAALGLTSVLVDPHTIGGTLERILDVSSADREALLVKFLSEILFMYDAEGFLTREVEIRQLTETNLVAKVRGEPMQSGKHRVRTDVKAITYHQLSVVKQGEEWVAVVYLDV